MIVHIPLFNVDMSEEVMEWTSLLIEIATFEIPKINMVTFFGDKSLSGIEQVFKDQKDKAALISKLDKLGYSSHYFSVSMSSTYIVIIACLFGLFLIFLLPLLKSVR